MYLQDLVKGHYGRRIAYCDYEEINEGNVVSVLGECIGIHNTNKRIIKYLWDYKNGDQPILYRVKSIREDVKNNIVENHAYEIVAFKTAQTFGEPVEMVSLSKDDSVSEMVDKFNSYLRSAFKYVRDIDCGEWQSAVGTAYKAANFANNNVKFRITVPTPMNTFVVYSSQTREPMMAVQELKDENKEQYYLCYTDNKEFRIKNGSLMSVFVDGIEVKSKLHAFGGIPIVEYPNNQSRISDIELVINLLDAINNMQSNRSDSIEQFVQSWIKFINCEIDKEQYEEMKKSGALVVKSNKDNARADVDIMTSELNQSQSQIAKDDLWDNALSILAIPNKQGNTGGDTQGAVELRNGWDFSKSRAKLKDPYVKESEMKLALVILNILKIRGVDIKLTELDFEPQINHSPTDNMMVKAQTFQMLVSAGIHPLIAIRTCGLWGDSEKVYQLSKGYLDALYKQIDDVIATIPNAEAQKQKAQELVNNGKQE